MWPGNHVIHVLSTDDLPLKRVLLLWILIWDIDLLEVVAQMNHAVSLCSYHLIKWNCQFYEDGNVSEQPRYEHGMQPARVYLLLPDKPFQPALLLWIKIWDIHLRHYLQQITHVVICAHLNNCHFFIRGRHWIIRTTKMLTSSLLMLYWSAFSACPAAVNNTRHPFEKRPKADQSCRDDLNKKPIELWRWNCSKLLTSCEHGRMQFERGEGFQWAWDAHNSKFVGWWRSWSILVCMFPWYS